MPDGLKGRPAFMIRVFDPAGDDVTGNWSMTDDLFGVVHVDLLAFRVDGAGRYTVRISYAGESFERVVTIP